MSILVENVSNFFLRSVSAEFGNGYAVLTLAVLPKTELFYKFVFLQCLLDSRPKGAGALAVDDTDLG